MLSTLPTVFSTRCFLACAAPLQPGSQVPWCDQSKWIARRLLLVTLIMSCIVSHLFPICFPFTQEDASLNMAMSNSFASRSPLEVLVAANRAHQRPPLKRAARSHWIWSCNSGVERNKMRIWMKSHPGPKTAGFRPFWVGLHMESLSVSIPWLELQSCAFK